MLNAGRLDESQYLLSKPRPTRKYRNVVKQPWPPKIETQVEPSASTQTPLFAPIPVAQLIGESEMAAVAKRVKNAGRKEWDCIVQRRALPGLSQDTTDDVPNPYTSPKRPSRPPATPTKEGRGQYSQSSSEISATPGWRKRAPPKQKQVFLPAESPQPIGGPAVPDSSSPRKVSAVRLSTKPEAVTEKSKKVKPEPPTFLGRIDRTHAFAKPEPIPSSKYQVQKNEDPGGLTNAMFAGKRIRTIGEADCTALRQELERAGAALVIDMGAGVDFYVVRLAGYALSRSCDIFANSCVQCHPNNEAGSTRR
jgi:hypothetical protein